MARTFRIEVRDPEQHAWVKIGENVWEKPNGELVRFVNTPELVSTMKVIEEPKDG